MWGAYNVPASDSYWLMNDYLKGPSLEMDKKLLSWKKKKKKREVSTSFKNLWQEGCVYIAHVNAFRRKDKEKTSQIIFCKVFWLRFSVVILPSFLKLWWHVFENCNRSQSDLWNGAARGKTKWCIYFLYLRTPLHHYKGAFKCFTMLHSVYEYINDICKVADDLRRAKAKHEAGNNQIASHVTMMLKKPLGYLRHSAHY